MNTEHTKGPWHANGKYVTAPHEGHVCVMRPIDTRPEAIDHANARLIAAAPCLLKALQEMCGALEDTNSGAYQTLADARAAIARATGH